MTLKKWVVVQTGHWMNYDIRNQKYLATKTIDDGTDEVRFETEVGFFGNEREKRDFWISGTCGPTLKNPVEHYGKLGWKLIPV